MSSHRPQYANDLKPDSVQAENFTGDYRVQPQPTFGQRLKNHYKRYGKSKAHD
jgi:hypothetical protein